MSDEPGFDLDSDEPRRIWLTGYEASLRLDELQSIIWQRMAEPTNRCAAFSDDELEMIVSWKQSLDAAVRMGSHRYEPDDSFGEAIEAELERRSVSDREPGGSS